MFSYASCSPLNRLFFSRVSLWFNKQLIRSNVPQAAIINMRHMSKVSTETEEQFDARYEAFFNNPSIDGWDVRKAMNDLCGMDLVPEPRIINAALKACRRVNDYALAVRFLEAIHFKCTGRVQEIYPYLLQEIKPTLDELGIDTPDKLGYDKPELALSSVYDN